MIAKLLKQTRKRSKLLPPPKARPRVPESDEGQFNRIEQERRAVPRPPDHPPPEYSPSVGILTMDQEIQRARAASRDSNRRQKDAEGRQTVPPPATPSEVGKWKHDRWLERYADKRARVDGGGGEGNRAGGDRLGERELPPRYTAPMIKVNVNVKVPGQTEVRWVLDVKASDTILRLKEQVSLRQHTRMRDLNFTYTSTDELEDHRPIHYYKITDGCTIHCSVLQPLENLLMLEDASAFLDGS